MTDFEKEAIRKTMTRWIEGCIENESYPVVFIGSAGAGTFQLWNADGLSADKVKFVLEAVARSMPAVGILKPGLDVN